MRKNSLLAAILWGSASLLLAAGNTTVEVPKKSGAIPALTTGSVVISNGTTITSDSTNFFWDVTNHRLGIGTNAPAVDIDVQKDGGAATIMATGYGTGNGALVVARNARGTKASPTAVQSGDTLGGHNFRGYGATGFQTSSSARVTALATQNWTDAAQGAALTFQVVPNGSTPAAIAEVMRIDQSANVGIGSTTPGKKLDVTGAIRASTSVITPVLAPNADGTTALQLTKADGTTSVLNVDTTNSRIGIGTAAPSTVLETVGTAITSTVNAIGAVATVDGFVGRNTTAATSGVTVQDSPGLHLIGSAWNTTTPAAESVEWRIVDTVFSGTSTSSSLNFISTINGANTTPYNFLSGGQLKLSSVANITSANNSAITLGTNNVLLERNTADANPAVIVKQTNASSTGDIFQVKNSGTTVAVIQQGGFVGIGSTTPGAKLELRNGHFKSTQTTATTAVVSSNAGTGATCTVANATDTAGTVTLTTTNVASATGTQCDVTFNLAYVVAPICTATAANAAASTNAVIQGVFFTATTLVMHVGFTNADATGRAYIWSYHCIETN